MARLRQRLTGRSPAAKAGGNDGTTALREAAVPVSLEAPASLDGLIEAMCARRLVLLGEATHGTQEFYEFRSAITLRLVRDHGFAGVVAEADWPDAARVHQYLQGAGDDLDARHALGAFERFPRWMWLNTVVLDLVEHLRSHNDALRDTRRRAGFWGMDLYSLYGSMAAVLAYLDEVDPNAAARARERYACFEPFGQDPQAYGAAAASGVPFDHQSDCEDEVVEQLLDLLRSRAEYAQRQADAAGGGHAAEEAFFFAEQNARLIANAERYYRTMYRGGANTWNLRDTHMADTLDALLHHLDRTGGAPARLVVWAHNSHLGDARQTEMSARGEINVGQLMRERYGADVFSLGFTTHTGTVAAADNWDEPPRRMKVNPSREASVERLCHRCALRDPEADNDTLAMPAFLLMPAPRSEAAAVLDEERLERAIGVIYRAATERWSHYFRCRPGRQFDALMHIDVTRALHPLDPFEGFEPGHAEAPETYPSGL